MNAYGSCPHCGANAKTRERRPNGNDECHNGHVYPSAASIPAAPPGAITVCAHFQGKLHAVSYPLLLLYARPEEVANGIRRSLDRITGIDRTQPQDRQ